MLGVSIFSCGISTTNTEANYPSPLCRSKVQMGLSGYGVQDITKPKAGIGWAGFLSGGFRKKIHYQTHTYVGRTLVLATFPSLVPLRCPHSSSHDPPPSSKSVMECGGLTLWISDSFFCPLFCPPLLLSTREISLLIKAYLLRSGPLESVSTLRSAVLYRTVSIII